MTEWVVLVIDDDAAIVQLPGPVLEGRILRADGVQWETGLELMRAEPVDLVLTDFMMPNLNGIEFARIVQTQSAWAQTKIMFMSANEQPEFLARALELGAIDYLPKSLGAETIVEKVLEHLGPLQPSAGAPHAQLTSLEHRLDKIELLPDHLLDLSALVGSGHGAPPAMQSLRQTALKIRDTARGAESSSEGSAPRVCGAELDRRLE